MPSHAPRRVSVVLVHGLWMHGFMMKLMQRRIARCGYTVHAFSYASVRCDLSQNAGRLARFIEALDADRVHIVAHSLGGVVAAAAAVQVRSRVGRLVFLGTPFAASYSGARLRRSGAGRVLLGRCMAEWLDRPPRIDAATLRVGVIAGSGALGMGRLIAPGLPKPHDGVVSVAETRVTGMCDHIVLDVSHTAMLFSPPVAREVCAFLSRGRFERQPPNA